MIIGVAMKTKEGEIFASRNSHSELIILYPNKFKNSKQGFITSDFKFVDRMEGLEIAKKYNQIIQKHGLDTELYSEDIFLKKKMDTGTLVDWYINSIDNTVEPIWTKEHIEELLKDFDVYAKIGDEE